MSLFPLLKEMNDISQMPIGSYCVTVHEELDLREKVIMKLAELVDGLRDSQWFPDDYYARRSKDDCPEQIVQQAVKECKDDRLDRK